MTKFMFVTDLHYGFERNNGHKVALHDMKALNVTLAFMKDWQPDVVIVGGDFLDCGVISHHSKNKPGRTEGMRLKDDAEGCELVAIRPIERTVPKAKLVYIVANHEAWLEDLTDDIPGLEGMLGVKELLHLGDRWQIVPQGGAYHLGKLTFIHGDQLSGGEHVAKNAVVSFERSIRFGHQHTYQAYTKASALPYKFAKTGIAVPCLSTKSPKYGEGRANRWCQGFNYGTISDGGFYSDYVAIIIDGQAVVNGKVYRG